MRIKGGVWDWAWRMERRDGWLLQMSRRVSVGQGMELIEGLLPGQLVRVVVTGTTAGGRIIQLSLDKETILKAQLNEVSNVSSILPGQQVSALVTAIMPNGLNVKLCGFFDGTIDLAHLALAGEDIEEKYKVGKKVCLSKVSHLTSRSKRGFCTITPRSRRVDSDCRCFNTSSTSLHLWRMASPSKRLSLLARFSTPSLSSG